MREIMAADPTVSMIARRARRDFKVLEVVEKVAYDRADYDELCEFRDKISKWRIQEGADTVEDWGNNSWAKGLGFERL
jgi:uncharacterized protein HemY